MNNIRPHQITTDRNFNISQFPFSGLSEHDTRLGKASLQCRFFIQHESSPELEPEARYCQNGRFPRESYYLYYKVHLNLFTLIAICPNFKLYLSKLQKCHYQKW